MNQNKERVEVRDMLIVDLGFSSAKFLYEDREGSIKSCFRRVKGGEGYRFRGDNYLVGERALLQTASHYLRTLDELVDLYPMFVGVAAEKTGAGVTHGGSLAVGLPFDFWKMETSKEKRGMANVIVKLRDSLRVIGLGDEEYRFEEVHVFPQGLGGVKDYLARHDDYGNILALDVGFNTVISTLYSCSEKEILVGKTYYKRGLHEMAVNLLMPEITGHIGGKTLTPIEIDHLVQTGNLQVGFDLIDIKPEIDLSASTYVKDLLAMVIGDLRAHGGVITFGTILLFGGGARLLEGKLEANKVKIVVLPNPEFANARGFAVRARELHGK